MRPVLILLKWIIFQQLGLPTIDFVTTRNTVASGVDVVEKIEPVSD
jgi:hypothetical protein